MSVELFRGDGFERAPPDNELFDERPRRYLLIPADARKRMQRKVLLDIPEARVNVVSVRAKIDRPIGRTFDHALFAEFSYVLFHDTEFTVAHSCVVQLREHLPYLIDECFLQRSPIPCLAA